MILKLGKMESLINKQEGHDGPGIAHLTWKKKNLEVFSFRCHGNQNSAWIPKN